MADYTFSPSPVLVETTGEFAIGATGVLRPTEGGDPVTVYDLNDSPLPAILVGPKGAHQAFKADIAAGILDFGSVLLPAESLEFRAAGLTAVDIAGDALEEATAARAAAEEALGIVSGAAASDTAVADLVEDETSGTAAALRADFVTKVSGGTAAAINAAAALADGVTPTVLLLDQRQPWTLENKVLLKSNTTLDLNGQTVKAIGGATKFPDDAMIANADQVNGNTRVRVINGKLDGDLANNAGRNFKGIYYKLCDHSEIDVDTANTPSRGWQIEGNPGQPKPRVIRLRGTVDNCGDYAVMVTNGIRDVFWDDVVVQNGRGTVAGVYIDASEQYGRIHAKFNAGSGIRFNNVFGCELQLVAMGNALHGVYVQQLAGSRVRIKSHNNGTLSGGVAGAGYADVYVSDQFPQSYGPNAESIVEFEAGPLTNYGGVGIYGAATEDYALYVADGNSAAYDFQLVAQRIGPGSLVAATRLPATKPGLTLTFPNGDRRVAASADVTLPQDGTFWTDTDLTASLPVGEYDIDGYVIYESTSTADIKMGLATPAGTTGSWTAYGPPLPVAAAGTSGSITFAMIGPAASQSLGATGTGNAVTALVRGRLVVTTAGAVSMRFAQNTAEATNTIRRAGSWLRLRRVA